MLLLQLVLKIKSFILEELEIKDNKLNRYKLRL